jgi:CheY-like chemotaxis protein
MSLISRQFASSCQANEIRLEIKEVMHDTAIYRCILYVGGVLPLHPVSLIGDSTLDPLQSPDGLPLSGEEFRQAKVEHFIERAQEFVSMGRYLSARKPIESALSLDPGNQTGKALVRHLEETLGSFGKPVIQEAGDTGVFPRRQDLVMVIDQDERLLLRIMQSLRKFGFRSVAAGGYQEARELLTLVTPDLVISEVNFENGPVGFDLYLMVRTNARLQGLPFLFLATRVDRETLIAGKRLGVNDFITKPLDEEVVYASIVSSLAKAKRTAGLAEVRR